MTSFPFLYITSNNPKNLQIVNAFRKVKENIGQHSLQDDIHKLIIRSEQCVHYLFGNVIAYEQDCLQTLLTEHGIATN